MGKKIQIAFIPHDGWHLTIHNLPPRSRLYSLPPIGVGTSYTESLSSYMQRLAQQHRLRPWQFYTHKLVPLIKNQEYLLQKDTRKTSIKQTFLTHKTTSSNLSVINGLQSITPVIVLALEQLTRRKDLRFLTLVSWFHLFSSYHSLLKQFCSWCPHCYQVWRDHSEVLYIPLLWLFKDVQFCPVHHIQLENICPYCHQKMLNFCQPGYCSHCGEWLGKRRLPLNLANYFFSLKSLKVYQQNIACLKDLIRMTPSLPKLPRIKDVYLYLHEHYSHLHKQELIDLCFSLRLDRDLITNPQKCDGFPFLTASLNFLYQVCRYCNISPGQLFL